jgi:hypothetical protein
MDLSLEKKIQILIDDGTGDVHRLEDMLVRNKTGKKLYNSDLLYLEKISPDEKPVVFTDDTFVFKKETKVDAVKEIVKQTVEQTSKLTIKRRIPVKLIITLSSIIVVSGLVFLGLYFQLDFLSDILIYNEFRDLFFTNIILPICNMELYWNPCPILN